MSRRRGPWQRKRRTAGALAVLFVAQSLLPVLALVALAPPAGASSITTDEAGRSAFDIAVTGVPEAFNVSVPAGAVVTSFRLGMATAEGQLPPDVPATVSLDLGGNGTDWAFGGGDQGFVGWQTAFQGTAAVAACSVGNGPCAFSFLLPNDARVESFSFDVTARANMTLWETPEFVSVVSGVAAVPLNLTGNSAVVWVDLNRDGTPNLVATGSQGALRVFERVGTSGLVFNETVGAVNPNLRQGRTFMHPQVADLSGDGVPDIVVGTGSGDVTLIVRKNGSQGPPFEFAEDTGFFAGVQVAADASPALGDLDGDGDLDLVVGDAAGDLFHYRNEIGESTGVDWQVLSTFLTDNVSVSGAAAPALADLDGDGDLDLTVGEVGGTIMLFENRGNRTAPDFTSAVELKGAYAQARATPGHVDVDGDGTPDLLYGSRSGLVYHSRALGGMPADVAASLNGVENPIEVADGTLVGTVRIDLSPSQRTEFAVASLPLSLDAWGNSLEVGQLMFNSSHFGDVVVTNLSIHYAATFVLPDLAAKYRAFAAQAIPQGNRIVAPVVVSGTPVPGATNPRVAVTSINVVVDDEPRFLEAPPLGLDEDTADPYLLDLRTIVADEDPTQIDFEIASNSNDTFAQVSITDGAYLGVDVASGDLNDNWTGMVDIVVRATDRLGQASLSPPIHVAVRPVRDAPVIENIPVQYLAPNESLRLTVRAIDGDPGDHVRFSVLPPSPSTASIDAETGFLYWNPTSAERAPGRQHFFIYASDGTLGDVQAFQVVMIPSSEPVFGRPLPGVVLLPGRPEFLNLFDFATGNVDEILSIALDDPAHPFVNLSADGRWLAFDYPADYAPGADRVKILVETGRENETAAVDLEIQALPDRLFIAPFSPTPIGRDVTHRVELLRYTYHVEDFRNLSFSVDNPLASISGYNLTLLAPSAYPGQSLSVTVTVRAGDEESSTRWQVNLQPSGELPRLARLPTLSGGVRLVDLSWALAPRGIGPSAWPLSTDSERFAVAGADVFTSSYPDWPLAVAARDFWPIERARILDSAGKPVLEVETAYDGRGRYLDRVQYFAEDAWAVVDATFATRPELAGGIVHNMSIIGTGPFASGTQEAVPRLDGGEGVGWRITFSRDSHLEQLSVVGLSEGAGTDATVSWPIWAVVTPRDDPPVYTGGAADIVVDAEHTVVVDLSAHFQDEEDDDLLFTLTQAGTGVFLDRSTGLLRVDGVEELNLTGVRVIAEEARNQSLFAKSTTFNIRLNVTAEPPPAVPPSTIGDLFSDPLTLVAFLLVGVAASAGLTVYFWTRRRGQGEEEFGEGATWEAVSQARPPPTEPPIPGDPAMVALDEEWGRVIASRHTEGVTPAEDTEADLAEGVRSRARAAAHPQPTTTPEEPRRATMSSSDTETERRAGDTETEAPRSKRRLRRR